MARAIVSHAPGSCRLAKARNSQLGGIVPLFIIVSSCDIPSTKDESSLDRAACVMRVRSFNVPESRIPFTIIRASVPTAFGGYSVPYCISVGTLICQVTPNMSVTMP